MALTANQLTVTYTGPDAKRIEAIENVSFTLEPQTFVCLLGPSGCGKSTVIRLFAGLQKPTAGHAYLNQTRIQEPSPEVAVMFQESSLMPWRTVRDNIALPLELSGVPVPDRQKHLEDLLPLLDLSDFADAYPGELSGGMAQRVALGRVLIQDPSVLLLDEPFGALDALTREQISLDLLAIHARQKLSVLMVTHDINEAVLLADRLLVMSRRPGSIIADIPVPLSRPRHLDMLYEPAYLETTKQLRAAIDRA